MSRFGEGVVTSVTLPLSFSANIEPLTLLLFNILNDGIPIPTIGTPSTYISMIGRRLHLGLDATSVSDILSFISRPKGNLEKHLAMILVDIVKEQVCLKYRRTRVYDYNRAIDWFILIARLLSTITFRDKSSDDVYGSWKEVPRILWVNGRNRKERNPAKK
jgi:hypothetical protein